MNQWLLHSFFRFLFMKTRNKFTPFPYPPFIPVFLSDEWHVAIKFFNGWDWKHQLMNVTQKQNNNNPFRLLCFVISLSFLTPSISAQNNLSPSVLAVMATTPSRRDVVSNSGRELSSMVFLSKTPARRKQEINFKRFCCNFCYGKPLQKVLCHVNKK
jgi:hypothetical protein